VTSNENHVNEFKETYDHDDRHQCLKLIKEVIALANADGGEIHLGLPTEVRDVPAYPPGWRRPSMPRAYAISLTSSCCRITSNWRWCSKRLTEMTLGWS
jgi:hypothetical protein